MRYAFSYLKVGIILVKPSILRLHSNTVKKLLRLKKTAEMDGCYRIAKRIHATILSSDGKNQWGDF